jgi:hypothetical protein
MNNWERLASHFLARNGHALAFELDAQQRVTGFRVGAEPFVTAVEFCG